MSFTYYGDLNFGLEGSAFNTPYNLKLFLCTVLAPVAISALGLPLTPKWLYHPRGRETGFTPAVPIGEQL